MEVWNRDVHQQTYKQQNQRSAREIIQVNKADGEKMALTPPVCSVNDVHHGQRKDRPTFHPSLWGDFFLTYQPPTAPKVTSE
jgi:hypothetical protein